MRSLSLVHPQDTEKLLPQQPVLSDISDPREFFQT